MKKVALRDWYYNTPHPFSVGTLKFAHPLESNSIIEMSDDEFWRLVKSLHDFRYEKNVGTRKKPAITKCSIYVMVSSYISAETKEEITLVAIDTCPFRQR